MNDWTVLLVIYAAIFISSPLIVVLHELGHALAYLVLTKPSRIDVYVGSYGDSKNNIHFKTGKLHFYIKRSFPFVKGIGLCKSDTPETDYKKDIVILLAGVFFTFLSAGIIALIAFSSHANFLVQTSCYIFLGFSFFSLLSNLVPREISGPISARLSSDGEQLLLAFRIKKALPFYVAALKSLSEKDYSAAIINLKIVTEAAPKDKGLSMMLIPILLETKHFEEASVEISKLQSSRSASTELLFFKGCLQALTNDHANAITSFSEVIKKDKNHVFALTNIGFELIEEGAHVVAKRALDRAIKLKPNYDQPYANLAYSNILQGELNEAKLLANKCVELDPTNALAYKVLGIYYLRLQDKVAATENFEKAKSLDDSIDLAIYEGDLKVIQQQS